MFSKAPKEWWSSSSSEISSSVLVGDSGGVRLSASNTAFSLIAFDGECWMEGADLGMVKLLVMLYVGAVMKLM